MLKSNLFLKSLCFSLIFSLVLLPLSHAKENSIADVKKGDAAPFTGVLMSNDVATKLYLDSKFSSKECDIKIREKIDIEKLSCKKDKSLLSSELSIERRKYEKILSLKNDRIRFLEKKWNPSPWYESGEFWFATGLVSGLLITIASGYALSQASR